jgi:hypothetical protein
MVCAALAVSCAEELLTFTATQQTQHSELAADPSHNAQMVQQLAKLGCGLHTPLYNTIQLCHNRKSDPPHCQTCNAHQLFPAAR